MSTPNGHHPVEKHKPSRQEKIVHSLQAGSSITRVSVPCYHRSDNVVVYEVDVSNNQFRWNLWLRYEYFYVLHQTMQQLVKELVSLETPITLPPFPEKHVKLLTDHFDDNFIENRRALLENYLVKLLQNQYLRHFEVLIDFLTPAVEEPDDVRLKAAFSEQMHQGHSGDNGLPEQAPVDEKFEEEKRQDGDSKIENKSQKTTESKVPKEEIETQTETDDDEDEEEKLLDMDLNTMSAMYTAVPMEDIDETDEITNVSIPQTQILRSEHTVYHVHLINSNKRESFAEWVVLKRYQDLVNFHNELCAVVEHSHPNAYKLVPPLPPKHWKIFTDHLSEMFIERRRILLQNYLQRLLKCKLFRKLDVTLDFFPSKFTLTRNLVFAFFIL